MHLALKIQDSLDEVFNGYHLIHAWISQKAWLRSHLTVVHWSVQRCSVLAATAKLSVAPFFLPCGALFPRHGHLPQVKPCLYP